MFITKKNKVTWVFNFHSTLNIRLKKQALTENNECGQVWQQKPLHLAAQDLQQKERLRAT